MAEEKTNKSGLLASYEKCLVLGSTGYSGIASVDWDNEDLPNIVDYDVVVVDVRALDEAMLATISNEHFETLRTQLTRLLFSDGQIIVISDFKRVPDRPWKYPITANNYSWSPIDIGISDESGESRIGKESRYPNYLKHLERWSYYFFPPENCLSRECIEYFGPEYLAQDILIIPYIVNRYKKLITGSFIIEITENIGVTKQKRLSGEIVLLPLIEKLDHREAVRLVLEDLTGKTLEYTPPGWVDTVSVPHVTEVEEEIQKRENQIASLRDEIGQLNDERNALNSVLKLLYASGHDLEEIVQFCFEELGAEVIPAKYGQEEYVLRYEGKEYLVEVKGVSKSISLTHLRQLNDYILKYEEDTGQACRGILFGNAWRTIPPQERNTTDKPEFPDNVVKRAEEYNVALISSTRFFKVYCQFMNDTSKASLIMKEILNHNGVIGFESLTETED